MNRPELQHLLSRAAFGISLNHIQSFEGRPRSEVVRELIENSGRMTPFDLELSEFKQKAGQMSLRSKKDLVALIKNSKEKLLLLNNQWINGIMINEEELRERMLLFWANHFVCKDNNVYYMQLYLNTLKKNALGNFADLVKAVSKQPAMLKYLNGRQNRKQSPNENFARELMELFTLGEGQYSETDIKESARAFTGYSHNFNGDFVFRRFQHDPGIKSFLGEEGHFDGDDVINIILSNKQCARFICSKIYAYFVNPKLQEEHINELTDIFYQDYDIARLMEYLFTRDWFYNETNRGVKIKAPVDLLASAYRFWPFRFSNDRTLFKIQRLLGQSLLEPPNVAGWPGDRAWIDTNTLMIRLKLPSLIYKIHLSTGKRMDGFQGRRKNPINATFDPDYINRYYEEFSLESMAKLVLPEGLQKQLPAEVLGLGSKPSVLVRLMSLPEFQMS